MGASSFSLSRQPPTKALVPRLRGQFQPGIITFNRTKFRQFDRDHLAGSRQWHSPIVPPLRYSLPHPHSDSPLDCEVLMSTNRRGFLALAAGALAAPAPALAQGPAMSRITAYAFSF